MEAEDLAVHHYKSIISDASNSLHTSTYVAFKLQSLLLGTILCILGFIPVGVGLNCIDNRDGGRIPEPEAVLAE